MSRLRPDLVVAGALPVVCLAALLVVHPGAGDRDDAPREPVRSALTTASVVCPSAVTEDDVVRVTTATDADGELLVGLGTDVTPVQVDPGRPTEVSAGEGPLVVAGADELAPGLVAGRSGRKPLVATDCRPLSAEQWFTGLGAGATHRSVIELVNPNTGRAVGDIRLWSQSGPLEVPQLLGVSVPGGTTVSLDLGEIVPRRGELMAQVTTSRGRLAVDVQDSVDELGTGLVATDLVAPQAAPSSRNLLLGAVRGSGTRLLVVGNPGDDEVRATVKVVTPSAVFAPTDLETIAVPPGTTVPVDLSVLLADATKEGAIGLLVESTGPVAANLRQAAGGDLSEVAPVAPVADATAVLVPAAQSRLLLADAAGVGVATVVARDAQGKELSTKQVELTPGTGASVSLPKGTVLVTLTPERTSVRAALVANDADGTAVVQVRPLQVDGLVPDVRADLP